MKHYVSDLGDFVIRSSKRVINETKPGRRMDTGSAGGARGGFLFF